MAGFTAAREGICDGAAGLLAVPFPPASAPDWHFALDARGLNQEGEPGVRPCVAGSFASFTGAAFAMSRAGALALFRGGCCIDKLKGKAGGSAASRFLGRVSGAATAKLEG